MSIKIEAPPKARRTGFSRGRLSVETLLASPFYLFILLGIVVPLGYLIYASFQTGSPSSPTTTFTTDNFQSLFTEPRYRQALFNTLKLSLVVTTVSVLVGMLLAWFIVRTDMPGRKRFETLIPIPLFLSPLAGGAAWVILASESSGFLNVAFTSLTGAQHGPLNIYSFGGLVWTMSLFFIPYAYLFTAAPLRAMDGSLEEAARISGASMLRTLLRVTLPSVIPGVIAAFLMVFVLASEMFSIPGLIGVPADYYTLPYLIYQLTHYSPPNWPAATAAGLLLLLLMALGLFLQRYATRNSKRFVTVTGKGQRPSTLRLGGWRWAGFSLSAGYILVALVLLICALIIGSFMKFYSSRITRDSFTLSHWSRALGTEQFKTALMNTLTVAAIGPTITVVGAFVLVYLWQRTRVPFAKTSEMLAMLPISLPGIVFGVGILWASIATPLYGTLALLIIAYAARYLADSIRMFSSTIVQIDPSLDEAARIGGSSLIGTMRRISLPLLKEAGLSSWLLLFILMVRELNVAIMIYTGDSLVLPGTSLFVQDTACLRI